MAKARSVTFEGEPAEAAVSQRRGAVFCSMSDGPPPPLLSPHDHGRAGDGGLQWNFVKSTDNGVVLWLYVDFVSKYPFYGGKQCGIT